MSDIVSLTSICYFHHCNLDSKAFSTVGLWKSAKGRRQGTQGRIFLSLREGRILALYYLKNHSEATWESRLPCSEDLLIPFSQENGIFERIQHLIKYYCPNAFQWVKGFKIVICWAIHSGEKVKIILDRTVLGGVCRLSP